MAKPIDIVRAIEADDLAALQALGRASPAALRSFIAIDGGTGDDPLDAETWLPLHFAAANGRTGAVIALVDGFGVSVDSRTRYRLPTRARQTALMLAAMGGHAETVEALLERGAQVEVRDAAGGSPLSLAVRQGDRGIVSRLLDAGADPEMVDGQGRSSLHLALLAAGDPQVDTAEALSVATQLIGLNVEVNHACPREPEGFAPLHRAVAIGAEALGVIQALLARGADPTAGDPRTQRTAIDLARERAQAGDRPGDDAVLRALMRASDD